MPSVFPLRVSSSALPVSFPERTVSWFCRYLLSPSWPARLANSTLRHLQRCVECWMQMSSQEVVSS